MVSPRQRGPPIAGHLAGGDLIEQSLQIRERGAEAPDLGAGGLVLAQAGPAGHLGKIYGELPEQFLVPAPTPRRKALQRLVEPVPVGITEPIPDRQPTDERRNHTGEMRVVVLLQGAEQVLKGPLRLGHRALLEKEQHLRHFGRPDVRLGPVAGHHYLLGLGQLQVGKPEWQVGRC